jgi:hypothetical protein
VHQKELKIKRKFSNRANSSRESAPERTQNQRGNSQKVLHSESNQTEIILPEETIEDLKIKKNSFKHGQMTVFFLCLFLEKQAYFI